jgi:hypothetical protein
MSRGTRVWGPTILTDNSDGSRNIFTSTSAPSNSTGRDGDIWLTYTA